MTAGTAWVGPAGAVLVVRIVGAALNALILVGLTRLYPQTTIGQFGLIWAIWVIARVVGPLGYDQAALRFLSVSWERDKPSARAMAAWQLRRVMLANVWISGAGVGIALVAYISHPAYGLALLIAAVGLPLAASQGLMGAQARAIGRPIGPVVLEALATPFMIGLVALLPRLASSPSAELLPLSQLVVLVAVHLMFIWHRRYRRMSSRPAQPSNVAEQRVLSRTALAALAATAFSTRGPIILVAAASGLREAALFEVSQRIQNLGAMPTSSVAVVVSPIFARIAGASDGALRTLKIMVLKAGATAALPAIAFVLGMSVFGDRVLAIFGPGYEAAYWPALLLLLAAAVNALFGLSSNALLMSGGERVVRNFGLWQLVVVLVMVPIGVQGFGVTGAAAAVLGATALRDVSLWIVLMRR